jgi:hypothetical protein
VGAAGGSLEGTGGKGLSGFFVWPKPGCDPWGGQTGFPTYPLALEMSSFE